MQGIVIQGPTDYCYETIADYKDIPNVVFSTWDDEPSEKIEYIKSFIPIIQSSKPSFPGYLNINLQALSTYSGIKYLEQKGVKEILKIRSDLKVSNIPLLLDLLKNKNLSFLAICKPNVRPMYYELAYQHYSFDFPVDHIIYGNIESLKKCFDFQMEEFLPIPPESLIAYNYFLNSDLDFELEYSTFKQNEIDFFMNDCLENKIDITLLKEKYKEIKDIIKYHSDKNLYNY
jgi:hypothetical protein